MTSSSQIFDCNGCACAAPTDLQYRPRVSNRNVRNRSQRDFRQPYPRSVVIRLPWPFNSQLANNNLTGMSILCSGAKPRNVYATQRTLWPTLTSYAQSKLHIFSAMLPRICVLDLELQSGNVLLEGQRYTTNLIKLKKMSVVYVQERETHIEFTPDVFIPPCSHSFPLSYIPTSNYVKLQRYSIAT